METSSPPTEGELSVNQNGKGSPTATTPKPNYSAMAVAFGRNYFGALGGTQEVDGVRQWNHPSWSKDDQRISQVKCTAQSTLFLTEKGKVYQTGTLHGRKHMKPVPVTIPLPLKCAEISAGRHFCLARMEGGKAVVSWGAGHFGQLGVSHGDGDHQITFSPQPIVIERLLPQVIGSPITSIACGDWHALALSKSGRVWAWGSNRSQQCGRKPSLSASSQAPTLLVPLPVPLDVKATKIAAGRSHSVALCNENVYCWGSTAHGQCGNSARRAGVSTPRLVEGIKSVRILDIGAAGNHTLALSAGGRVFSWGSNIEGQLGTGPACAAQPRPRQVADLDFVSIEAGQGWRKLKNETNGEVDAKMIGEEKIAENLNEVPTISSIFAGPSYSAAISTSGHVYAWGSNDAGQTGIEIPPQVVFKDDVLPAVNSRDLKGKDREQNVKTFDSKHNILLPSRVPVKDGFFVDTVACGPNHMWCIGRSRVESDSNRFGRSLFEVESESNQVVEVKDNTVDPPASSVVENSIPVIVQDDTVEESSGVGSERLILDENGTSLNGSPTNTTGEADTAGTDTEASGLDFKLNATPTAQSQNGAISIPAPATPAPSSSVPQELATKPNRRRNLMKSLSKKILRRKSKK